MQLNAVIINASNKDYLIIALDISLKFILWHHIRRFSQTILSDDIIYNPIGTWAKLFQITIKLAVPSEKGTKRRCEQQRSYISGQSRHSFFHSYGESLFHSYGKSFFHSYEKGFFHSYGKSFNRISKPWESYEKSFNTTNKPWESYAKASIE